ncbi:helix-turn-helix transcriptional regulator [Hyphococcus sp.]|uniref:helix-turn-helix transcriptional regulator n=1 Tax=Hyphococcus sp. TaxID=2038636 RepID=UPI003CCC3FCC
MTQLLTESEAADVLGVSPRTLSNWRCRGGGPDYVKMGSKAIRYRLDDLNEFIDDRRQNNTSQDYIEEDFDDEDFDDEDE